MVYPGKREFDIMMRRIERENTGLLKAGQELVVVGYVGLAGTRVILEARKEELKNWFSEEYLDMTARGEGEEAALGLAECQGTEANHALTECQSMTADPGMEFWSEFGAVECEQAGAGGIFTAIWNLSGAYETGVEVSLRQIPVAQETIEVCERLELNPYRLYSKGCYLLAAENGGHMVRRLSEKGIPAAVVGSVNRGIAREILNAESRGFLERPQKDELLKIIPDYPF